MKGEFVRFVLVGGVAALANVGARALASLWIPFIPAVTLAFCVGITTAFLLNRSWVFARSGKRWTGEIGWFVVFNLLGLAQTLGVSWLLARIVLPALGQTEFVEITAHMVGVAVPLLTSYIGHKHVTFRRVAHATDSDPPP